MKETDRLVKLFTRGYDGSSWLDVGLLPVVKNISFAQAAVKTAASVNTIWEIINHIILWRKNVLKRVKGEVIPTPDHNYFLTQTNISEKAWIETLEKLERSQQEWLTFLQSFKEADFKRIYPNNNLTYYEHIQGILQHDVYHLGQIVLLSKLV